MDPVETHGRGGGVRHELSLLHPRGVLLRHWKKVLSCFLVLAALSVALVLSSPESYRSEAKLLVRIGRESVSLDPTASMGPTVDLRQDRDQELRAELAILQSPNLCRLVVQTLGAKAILEPAAPGQGDGSGGTESERPWLMARLSDALGLARSLRGSLRQLLPGVAEAALPAEEKAFLNLQKSLEIRLLENSSVLSVAYESTDPHLAQRVVDLLIAEYQEKHLDIHRTPGSYEFFEEQSQRFAGELDRAEQELKRMRHDAGFTSAEEQRRELHDRLAAVRTDLDSTEAGIAFSKAKAQALQGILSGLQDTVVLTERVAENPNAQSLRQRIQDLKLEERQALLDFNEDSRRVRGIRAQIDAAQALLEPVEADTVERTQGPNGARQPIQLELLTEEAAVASLTGRRESLRAREAELVAELVRLNETEFELARKQRDIEDLEKNYLRYAEGLEQARVSQALETEKISNIRVIQPASLPLETSGGGKGMFLALGLAASLLGSLGLAFVSESLDRSIKTPEEARERLRMPTLAAIPSSRGLRRAAFWKPQADLSRTSRNGSHTASAEFNELGDLIQAVGRGKGGGATILGITSSQRGEGVSTVSANLAAAMALQSEGPVLLVDAAWQSPSVHRNFRVELSPGLAECLSGQDELPEVLPVQESKVPNLRLLTAGRVLPGRPLVVGARLAALIERLRAEYSLVVVDLPPVNDGAVRMAASCDAVLLVIQAERLPRDVVEHGRELLLRCRANLIGTVLNRRRSFGSARSGAL